MRSCFVFVEKKLNFFVFSTWLALLSGCGGTGSGSGGGGRALSELESSLMEVSQKHQVPYKLLVAVGFVESRLNPSYGYAVYLGNEVGSNSPQRSIRMSESAFGVSLKVLGLERSEGTANIEVQANAYARWIRQEMDAERIDLPVNTATPEALNQWIWELARLHRGADQPRKNVRITFAKEVIQQLNEGILWQNFSTGEGIRLEPHNPPLNFDSDPNLALELRQTSEIPSAQRLRLPPLGRLGNKPAKVEVIHCPLSLSGCLELMSTTDRDPVRLEAHYVIPQDDKVFQSAIQIANHERAVVVTDNSGNNRPLTDRIVVMLVGQSGKIVNGRRELANPDWLTHWQLIEMARVISDVCFSLAEEGTTGYEDCTRIRSEVSSGQPNETRYVGFRGSKDRTNKWGDVADYDPEIFTGYLKNQGSALQGTANFVQRDNQQQYEAGLVGLELELQPRAKLLLLDTLIRCPSDGFLKWFKVLSRPLAGESFLEERLPIYSAGPNRNGVHYFRAKVYGNKGELLGWDIKEVYISNFEEGPDLRVFPGCS